MDSGPDWWPTFGRLAKIVGAWHLLPLVFFAAFFVWVLTTAHQQDACVDCGTGFALLVIVGWELMVVGSIVIGLMAAVVAAFFRPRRPILIGNLMMLTQVAVVTTLLLAGINR